MSERRSPEGLVLDAQLHLFDRQVLDADEVPVGVVDDIELTGVELGEPIEEGTPPPVIGSLLFGPVLGTRIFGGRPPDERLIRISWRDVLSIGTAIQLGVRSESLVLTWTERWVRDRIIGRIPGGRHDPE